MKLNINLHFLDCLDSPLFNLDIFYSINFFFLFTCIEAVWLCGTAACFLADITIYLRFPEFVCVLHSLPSCLKTEKLVKHFSALSSAFVHLPSMQRCASFGAASAGSHWCSQRWPDYARNDHKSSRLCLCVLERAVTSKPRGFVVTLWPESWTVCAEQAPESRPPSLSLSVVIICISTSRQRTDAIFSHNVKERQKNKTKWRVPTLEQKTTVLTESLLVWTKVVT